MATRARVFARRIPWTEDPVGYSPGGHKELVTTAHTGHVIHPRFSRGIFPTQGSNPGLLHCRRILYCLSHHGRPRILGQNFHCPNTQCLFNKTTCPGHISLLWCLRQQVKAQELDTHLLCQEKRLCCFLWWFLFAQECARAWWNTRRGTHHKEEVNKKRSEPRFFLLSSLSTLVWLTVEIIADQSHLINNLKQWSIILFDLHGGKFLVSRGA